MAACALASRPARTAATGASMRVGLTPVILADQSAFLRKWAEYLSRESAMPVSFMARGSYQEIVDALLTGAIEVAWICGYPYVRHRSVLDLLAVPVYDGHPLYRAYLIRSRLAARDLTGWTDLADRVLAYSDPLSNSGWLVAQAQLHAHGVLPTGLRRGFFAYGHRNVAEAVAAGLAHAGSIDGYVWETMRLQGMTAIEQTDVVWQSEYYGFPPLVVHRHRRDGRAQALLGALQGMGGNPDGRDLLRALNLTGFAQADPVLFDSIAALARRYGQL